MTGTILRARAGSAATVIVALISGLAGAGLAQRAARPEPCACAIAGGVRAYALPEIIVVAKRLP